MRGSGEREGSALGTCEFQSPFALVREYIEFNVITSFLDIRSEWSKF